MPHDHDYEEDDYSDELDIHPTGGGRMFSPVYRSDQEVFGGAAPPIVSDTPTGATQWLVKVDKNGRPQEVGSISIRASVDDLIETFHASIPEGGTVYLFPIDMSGALLKDTPIVKDISPGHQAYARLAKKRQLAQSVGSGSGFSLGGINSMQDVQALIQQFQTQQEQMEQRFRERERQLAEEQRRREEEHARREQAMREKEDRLARERLALQAESQEKFHEVTLRMVEKDQERNQGQMDQMTQMFAAMNAQADRGFQQTLQLIKASADEDRRRDKERLEEERRRAEERERQRDKEHQRYLERAREEARMRREEDQKYHERQMELIRKQGESNDLTKQITKALAVGSKWGLIPEGGLGALLSMGGKSSMAETIAGVLGKGIDAALEAQKTQIEAAKDGGLLPGGEEDPLVQVQMPTGQILVIRQSEYMEMQAQMQAQGQMQGQPQIPQQALAGQGPAPLGPQPQMAAPQQPPQPQVQPQPQQAAAPAPKDDFLLRPTNANPPAPEADTSPAAGLPPRTQKQGRAAGARVVEVIHQNAKEDDDTAEIEVSAAILHELINCEPFADYLAAVSVEGALQEAGVEQDLIDRTIRLALNNVQVAENQKSNDRIPMRKGDL